MQSPLISSLQQLAAKWHVISLLAVAFAQLLRRYENSYTPGTAELAGQLEITLRAAHVLVLQEIKETESAHPAQSPECDHALALLRLIAACLLAVSLIAANIRARALPAALWMRRGVLPLALETQRLPIAAFYPPSYLDSG